MLFALPMHEYNQNNFLKCIMRLKMVMFLWLLFNQSGKCLGSPIEIDVVEQSGSKMKLICEPPNSKSLETTEDNLLREGSKFDPNEQKKVALNAPSNISVPNLKSNATIPLRCRPLRGVRSKKNMGTKKLDDGESRPQREMTGEKAPKLPEIRESGISKKGSSQKEHREIAGTIQKETGNCPPGQRIDQDRCFPCFPGSYTSGQETECFLCPKDFYSREEGADSCRPCPGNRKTPREGADSEDACIDPLAGVHESSTSSINWTIIIILLILLLVCLCVIVFLWIHGRRSIESVVRKDEETGVSSFIETSSSSDQEQGTLRSKRKRRYKRHKRQPNLWRQLTFDIGITGSATLTDGSSSKSGDAFVAKNVNDVAETGEEDATEVKLINVSPHPSKNMIETSIFNDGKTYLYLDSSTENKAEDSVPKSNVQKNIAENDSREDGGIRETSSIGVDESYDSKKRTGVIENETTVKEPFNFEDRSNIKNSLESVHKSELFEFENSEDRVSSNDRSSSQHAVEKAPSAIESISKGSESRIKQISANEPFEQNVYLPVREKDYVHVISDVPDENQNQQITNNVSRRNEGVVFKRDTSNSRKWYWEKPISIPVEEKDVFISNSDLTDANQSQRHQYENTYNVSHRHEGVISKNTIINEPTSCHLHRDTSNSRKWYWENSMDLPVREKDNVRAKSDENRNQRHRNERGVGLINTNLAESTSCQCHRDSQSRCHIEVDLTKDVCD